MHIDALVGMSSSATVAAIIWLAERDMLHHIRDRQARVVVDSRTQRIPAELASAERLRGLNLLGGIPPSRAIHAGVICSPTFGDRDHRKLSAPEHVWHFLGLNCVRVEDLGRASEPAELIVSDDPVAVRLMRVWGMASPDALQLEPSRLTVADVAGKTVVGYMNWGLAIHARQITSLPLGLTTSLRSMPATSGMSDDAAADRILAVIRKYVVTYRVHEVSPDELRFS
jgi:hypothetical protein